MIFRSFHWFRPFSVLFVCIFMLIAPRVFSSTSVHSGPCERGLFKCLVVSAAALGAPLVSASLATFCLNGYVWCKNYYPE